MSVVLLRLFTCLLCAICLTPSLYSQELRLQFAPPVDATFKQPVIAGRAGDHFVVIDAPEDDQMPAWLFAPDLSLVKKMMLPARAFGSLYGSSGDKVFFTWQERTADSSILKMVSLDKAGDMQEYRYAMTSQETLGGYKRIIADKRGNFLLFYSLLSDAAKHVVINGAVFDSGFRLLKTFKTAVDHDAALERLVPPILDTKGNVHVLVYDKLTNYRLSGHIRMNTLALEDQAITTESFEFEKAKFYDVVFFDNPANEQVEVAGFYYDGSTKIKQGLAAIQFPYTRNQTMKDRFMPLSVAQRQQLQDGMKWVRRKNDVMDFVKMRDIIEEDGQVFLSGWVLDISAKDFLKDNEDEDIRNTDPLAWFMVDKSGNAMRRTIRSTTSLYADRFSPMIVGVSAMPEVSSLQAGGNIFLNAQVTLQRRIMDMLGPMGNTQRIGVSAPMIAGPKIPSKLAYFHINASGDSSWQQVLPGDFPVVAASYQPVIWHYPLAEQGKLYFISPSWADTRTKRDPLLIRMQKEKVSLASFTGDYPQSVYISRPIKLAEKKYLSAYSDKGKRGLVVLEIAE